ncbi:MAG: hypothetical protein LUH05_03950 [Candidatus Gastranaerophilales bacterium]|nr:hypothetical protein [Candidatus Gastranaerophilales bacterium]
MSYLQNLLNVYTGNTGGYNNNNQNNINTSFAGNNNNDNSLFNLLTQKISGTQGLQAQNQKQNQGQGQGQAQDPTSSLLNPFQMNTQNQLAYTAGKLGNMAIKAALL